MHCLVRILTVLAAILNCTPFESARAQNSATALGLFEGHADVGATRHLGSVDYDAARRRYTVTGGGENMWFTNDAFHFVWNKVSDDVTLAADVAFIGMGRHSPPEGLPVPRPRPQSGFALPRA